MGTHHRPSGSTRISNLPRCAAVRAVGGAVVGGWVGGWENADGRQRRGDASGRLALGYHQLTCGGGVSPVEAELDAVAHRPREHEEEEARRSAAADDARLGEWPPRKPAEAGAGAARPHARRRRRFSGTNWRRVGGPHLLPGTKLFFILPSTNKANIASRARVLLFCSCATSHGQSEATSLGGRSSEERKLAEQPTAEEVLAPLGLRPTADHARLPRRLPCRARAAAALERR